MLKDKVVVITGAGSGLGRELCKVFCKEGYKVVGFGRSQHSLKETQLLITQSGYDSFSFHSVDIVDFDQVQQVINDINNSLGSIDLLFNNATSEPKKNFLDESAKDFSEAINTNIVGIANTCKAVLPIMIKNKTGRIFNRGSWADLSPIANSTAYSASKGAVHALTKGIAVDIASHNVDVQVHEWIPGHLNTETITAGFAFMLAQRKNTRKNTIFVGDQEWLPPKRLKEKIKSKLLFWNK
jgi:NADP-dependent 3-hydroxy acid dehydrogenase YdfG